MEDSMTGAELLVKTAVASGVEACFLNPGTTEMLLVRAFDAVPGVRAILGLFEGVCTGAADGYGRITGKPAMTLFHQGPGLANGIANFHNAQQARTPVLNVVGDHATWHRAENPTFHLDIEALAGTVSDWHRSVASVDTLSKDVADAVMAAQQGQIASLIVPNDYQLAVSNREIARTSPFTPEKVDDKTVESARALLTAGSTTALLLGGKALRRIGLSAAARIRAATGCDLFTEIFPTCWDRGAGLPVVQRTAHLPGQQDMRKYQGIVLAGAKEPVTFSGREGFASRLIGKEQKMISFSAPGQDVVEALERLAEALSDGRAPNPAAATMAQFEPPDVPEGELTAEKACRTLAAIQPEGAILVDEGITSSWVFYPMSSTIAPHTVLTAAGTTIGWGMPCAVGAAISSQDRPVIVLQADGSAMFTVQALWTQAREGLNVTTLILANRRYNALRTQISRDGVTSPGPITTSVIELQPPRIDWIRISQGLGVPAVSVNRAEEMAKELRVALTEPGPHVIEIVLR
jgi:acetolactate synthase I/II/III large subunit